MPDPARRVTGANKTTLGVELVVSVLSVVSRFLVDDVQLYTITGFDLISRKQLEVMVYPNPSSDLITIRRNTSEMAQVNIYKLNGQLLKQETICNDVSEIDLMDLCNPIISLFYQKRLMLEVVKFCERLLM